MSAFDIVDLTWSTSFSHRGVVTRLVPPSCDGELLMRDKCRCIFRVDPTGLRKIIRNTIRAQRDPPNPHTAEQDVRCLLRGDRVGSRGCSTICRWVVDSGYLRPMTERSISERINEALAKESGARYREPAIIFTVSAYEEYKKALAAPHNELVNTPAGNHPFYRRVLPH